MVVESSSSSNTTNNNNNASDNNMDAIAKGLGRRASPLPDESPVERTLCMELAMSSTTTLPNALTDLSPPLSTTSILRGSMPDDRAMPGIAQHQRSRLGSSAIPADFLHPAVYAAGFENNSDDPHGGNLHVGYHYSGSFRPPPHGAPDGSCPSFSTPSLKEPPSESGTAAAFTTDDSTLSRFGDYELRNISFATNQSGPMSTELGSEYKLHVNGHDPMRDAMLDNGNGSVTVLVEYERKQPKTVGKYILHETIGKGAWGKVRKATLDPSAFNASSCGGGDSSHTDNQCSNLFSHKFAIKIINKRLVVRRLKDGVERLYTEFKLVSKLSHPNILKYYDLFPRDDFTKYYLAMEYCERDLETWIEHERKSRTVPDAHYWMAMRQLCCDLFKGLDYLHGAGIAHHDIKSSNLLISPEGSLKISDFGIAEKFRTDPWRDECMCTYGTPAFQAPEIITKPDDQLYYSGTKADMYSAGVVLYNMATGALPHEADTVYLLFEKIAREEPVVMPRWLDPLLSDLIKKLLMYDPKERPSARQVLSHPWLQLSTMIEENALAGVKKFSLSKDNDDLHSDGGSAQDGSVTSMSSSVWQRLRNRLRCL